MSEIKKILVFAVAVCLWICTAFSAQAGDPEILFEINITAQDENGNTRHFDGVWFDTALSREIAAYLPLKVGMHEFGGREFYGRTDFTPETEVSGQLNFSDGDITFCFENNTMAIFYNQSSRPDLTMEVIPLGRVISDLQDFADLNRTQTFVFERKSSGIANKGDK